MNAASRVTAALVATTRGDASAITGSRLSAGVFQSDSSVMFLITAGTNGSASGVQNRIVALRRSSRGNQLSAIAASDGRKNATTSNSAPPAYAMVPSAYLPNELQKSACEVAMRRV